MNHPSECLSCIARSGWFEKLYKEMLVGTGETTTKHFENTDQCILEQAFEAVAMIVIEEAISDNTPHTVGAPEHWSQRRESIKAYFNHIKNPSELWVMVLDRLLSSTLLSSSGKPPDPSRIMRVEAEDLVEAFIKAMSPEVVRRCCSFAEHYRGYRCDRLEDLLATRYQPKPKVVMGWSSEIW